MSLTSLDWSVIIGFFVIVLAIGIWASRTSGKNTSEFFLSGRNMPWWLLGMSMVATTFSTDTPNLVTDIVRQNGVAGNWVWWAFCLTGMLTVFVYARLWRKSGVTTDMEFYELRYSGKPARILRGFRAVYLGLVFNVLAMAGVCLAAMKIGEVMFGWDKVETIGIACVVTVIFSALGGLRGVIYTDFALFFVAMAGALGAAYVAVNHEDVGGLTQLLAHENVQGKLSILPDFSNTELALSIFFIPLAVQWWNAWYPGAEPGGGGYIAQRMLASKDESHAIRATFFFNILHYALRPWPWILVDVIQNELQSLTGQLTAEQTSRLNELTALKAKSTGTGAILEAFPNVSIDKLGNDLGYPAMLSFLPAGLMGLVVASLVAAFMSTISTHLNWGASYLVNDFWKRFVKPEASDKELVTVGRVATLLLMVLGAITALFMTNAKQLFDIILMFGAGTGLLFILRWFWWRINAWAEIAAMIVSGIVSIGISLGGLWVADWPSYMQLPVVVFITTIAWVTTMYITKPESEDTLRAFYKKLQPGGPGWNKVVDSAGRDDIQLDSKEGAWNVPSGILAMLVGTMMVYAAMFATGYWIYGETSMAMAMTGLAVFFGFLMTKLWNKVSY